MEKLKLVMIASPLMGHFTQSLELAKLMLGRNNHLSITALIMQLPIDPEGTAKIQSVIDASEVERLHFHRLPSPDDISQWNTHRGHFTYQLIDYLKPHVREIASKIKGLSGFLIDLINTTMIDVADELGVPTYIFFTCGAAFLGLSLHLQSIEDEQNQEVSELVKSETELTVPSFAKPVPISVLPTLISIKQVWSTRFLKSTRDFRRAKGVLVNTFADLESYALHSFSLDSSSYGKSGLPPIVPVGPILNRSQIRAQYNKDPSGTMNWLDSQPENSVVFLCFGSIGSFHLDQVQEIAYGLERSGYRFIWVVRQPPAKRGGFASDYENLELVLPEGFLDRTASIGKVVGWIPQLAVLSHSAVGGFVSHCGWNSTLESIFCGVPIATWPLQAEQQLNAFQLVKELGIAVEISLDYNGSNENQALVRAEQVEKGIRELMDDENEVRKRVKELSEKSRLAIKEGGSSYLALENIIQEAILQGGFVAAPSAASETIPITFCIYTSN